ncbi:anaphase-promoting complex subunit 10, partial [Lecanoromycetidae sp. Uapishka_2]
MNIREDDNLTPDWLRIPSEYRGPATPPYYQGLEGVEHVSAEAANDLHGQDQGEQGTTDQATATDPAASGGPRPALRGINPITGIDEHVEQFRILEAANRILEARLARTHNRNTRMAHQQANTGIDPGQLGERIDDVSLVDDLGEEDPLTLDPTQDPFLPPNLKEISSLASWQVSTCKPNCGVEALRSHSPAQFWQSDGPQPHLLTIHFHKWVKIVKLRVYLDFLLDESYTPTRMTFWG